MKKFKWAMIFAAIAALCFTTMLGCSDESSEEEIKTIGTIYQVTLENKTGQNITGLAIKDSSMNRYSDNKLTEDTFAKDEKRILVYDATKAEAEADGKSESDGSEDAAKAQYDIQLTFSDGEKLVLTDVPFTDMEEGQICLEDDVAFLKYTSKETGEEISTKDAELKLKEAADQKAAEAAEAKQKAEEEAAAQAAAEAAAAEAAATEAAAQNYNNNGGGSGSSSSNADGCIGNEEDLLY